MDELAWSQWWKQAWPSLMALVIAAAAAFLVGAALTLWKARIQKRYQQKVEKREESTPEGE